MSVECLFEASNDVLDHGNHEPHESAQRIVPLLVAQKEVKGRNRLVNRYVDGEVGVRYEVPWWPGHTPERRRSDRPKSELRIDWQQLAQIGVARGRNEEDLTAFQSAGSSRHIRHCARSRTECGSRPGPAGVSL